MRILMVDNHDSFTYNIVNMVRARGVEVDVVDNDADTSAIDTEKYDGLIISPGPGSPLNERDRGNSVELLQNGSFSAVLGICFGHQLIGHHDGCRFPMASSIPSFSRNDAPISRPSNVDTSFFLR